MSRSVRRNNLNNKLKKAITQNNVLRHMNYSNERMSSLEASFTRKSLELKISAYSSTATPLEEWKKESCIANPKGGPHATACWIFIAVLLTFNLDNDSVLRSNERQLAIKNSYTTKV